MKQFLLISLASALLLTAGCNNDDGADGSDAPAPVTLLTRGATEATAGHRLLVFPASGHAGDAGSSSDAECLLNYSFTSGNALTLAAGSYRFVTLTESSCLDLPVAGETDGLLFDKLLTLKDGASLEAVQVSEPAEVTFPGTTSYTASLQPATCLLKLQLADAPEGLTLQLTNMYGGIPLSGKYPEDAPVIAYSLHQGENICLPTGESAILQYQYKEESGPASGMQSGLESGTLNLGMSLDPGYTYSASLQWHNEELKITSTVEKWEGDDNTTGDAE